MKSIFLTTLLLQQWPHMYPTSVITQESIQIPKYKLTTIVHYYIMPPLPQQHPIKHQNLTSLFIISQICLLISTPTISVQTFIIFHYLHSQPNSKPFSPCSQLQQCWSSPCFSLSLKPFNILIVYHVCVMNCPIFFSLK